MPLARREPTCNHLAWWGDRELRDLFEV